MDERPDACPACRGTMLIRSGRACGRQRWRCKSCGRQFTRTEPRGKPAALKLQAIELYCLGLSMNAVDKRVALEQDTGTTLAAVVEIDEVWHFVEKSRTSSGSGRRSSAAPAG